MKNSTYLCLVGTALLMSAPVFAENRAANINIVSDGGGVDAAALRAARKIVGHAIASSTADTFVVYSPRIGGPIPIEGGLSGCVEEGFSSTSKKFDTFLQKLRSIHPRRGTVINVEPVSNCKPIEPRPVEPLACGGIAGIQCPGGQVCVDDPADTCDPSHGGRDCSGICVANPK